MSYCENCAKLEEDVKSLHQSLNRQVRATNSAIARGQNLAKHLKGRQDDLYDAVQDAVAEFEHDEKIALENIGALPKEEKK